MIGFGYSLTRRRGGGVAAMPAPTLAFDFIANPVIPPGFALSRASSATYTGTDGMICKAGANVARFDADPLTLASGGLLIEPARTNLLVDSHYSSGHYSEHGTVTRTDGIAGPDGNATASRFVTADMQGGAYTSATVASNENYVASACMRDVANDGVDHSVAIGWDTGSGSARFDTITNAVLNKGTAVSETAYRLLKGGWARYAVIYNSSSHTSTTSILYGTTNYTFDAWGAQLEQGSYPSSYIETSGATVTRAADVLTSENLSWLNASQGTIVIDTAIMSVGDGGTFAFSLDDGANNGIGIYKALGSGAINAYAGSATGTPLSFTATDGQRIRAGIAWNGAGASASASINGAKAIAIAGAKAISPKALSIGSARNGQFIAHLRVRSFTYWPYRMADADLAALTVVPAA